MVARRYPILQYWAYGVNDNTLSHETCMQACYDHDARYTYIGLENGESAEYAECWCGTKPALPPTQVWSPDTCV